MSWSRATLIAAARARVIPPTSSPSLHMGVKLHDVYVDPLDYLSPMSVSGFIRLAALCVTRRSA